MSWSRKSRFCCTSLRRYLRREVWIILCHLVIFAGLILATTSSLHAQPKAIREARIKAAILYYLAKFVDWPSDKTVSSEDPIRVCLFGEDPMNKFVEPTLLGKAAHGRKLTVLPYPTSVSKKVLQECHMLYFGKSSKALAQKISRSLRQDTVLTISSLPDFAIRDGVVELFEESNRVQIRINPVAAERAKLILSSELLNIATVVKDPSENGTE